ncbi:hypothetical protein ACQEVG_02940 [Streptomyces sp. CA-135486]|uniref:hypothetical protein n=1 Tax=Streptomyces sp. CA-135486 TaxID=3240049 RepID=UPI003D8E35EF
MRVRRVSVALASVIAALAIPTLAAPAHAAANSEVRLTTTWAKAVAGWTWRNDRLDPVGLSIQDTRADGYPVGIQLVTESSAEGRHVWPLHTVTTGSGTGLNHQTFAITGRGPLNAWIRICKVKGGSIYTCLDSEVKRNPIDDSRTS